MNTTEGWKIDFLSAFVSLKNDARLQISDKMKWILIKISSQNAW